jgi:hypothetical protein
MAGLVGSQAMSFDAYLLTRRLLGLLLDANAKL